MPKSLEYVKSILLSDRGLWDYTPDEIDKAQVIPAEKFFRGDKLKPHKSQFWNCNVTIKYTPENDFDYFSSETAVHDGTLALTIDTINMVVFKIYTGSTFDNRRFNMDMVKPEDKYMFEYEIGDIVVIERFGYNHHIGENVIDGLKESVCIPVKFNFEKVV